ncbi:ABC transporter ATP-binding protein [Arthrobacter sp. PAMC25564]|uniref:ABC transporter ATP-binding protein n=1 Tax=Arthrobacter sp. PAMC25564 TaxID=2565366 RepID=UPI0010A256D9|nr:ABC transporter ATP-binding protein [Arthrobacter sp. PAMC25564]QCB99019.1 ABC transporter ATP-binding protein [Arthrobacter sp. PAMC25564]
MRRLLSAHKATVLAIVLLQLVQTTANLLLPTLNAAVIDEGIVGGNIPEIPRLGAWMAGIAAVQVVAAVAAGYLGAVVAMDVGRQLREELFAKVQSMSSQEVGAFGAPSLVTRATNDVTQIQNLAVLVFTMLVAAPAIFLGGIALAIHQDVALSGIVMAVIPVLALIMAAIVRRLIPLYREGQELIDRISRVLREQIIGANVIRGFVRQGHEIRRFDGANKDLTRNNLHSALLVAGMMPMIMLVVNLSSVAVVWFGGHRIQAGEMRLGALTAFIAYILQILIAIMMAMYVFTTAPRAAVCAERIQAVLDTVPAIADPAPAPAPAAGSTRASGGPAFAGNAPTHNTANTGNTGISVEFRGVTFAYPGAEAPVLDGISFTAVPGTTTAVIGATGSGKTTLLNLIPRFLDATGGEIRIGGRNIRGLPLGTLRGLISMVPQQSYLFSGTIADNLRMGSAEASDEELWQVLGTAQAGNFVRGLPRGLGSAVSEGGTNFSGGQRQRLCIARALLRAAPVYLFDDSFSALDYGTDLRLRAAIEPLLRSATVLIVAERVATIVDAGLILVLEGGRLVAQGTHQQLMESSRSYQEIAASQLVLEETP